MSKIFHAFETRRDVSQCITEKALAAFDQEPFAILSRTRWKHPRDKIAFRASAIFPPRGLARFSHEVIISRRPGNAYISETITVAVAIKTSFFSPKDFSLSLSLFKYRTHCNGRYSRNSDSTDTFYRASSLEMVPIFEMFLFNLINLVIRGQFV